MTNNSKGGGSYVFNFSGTDSAIVDKVRDVVVSLLEGSAIQMGAPLTETA